MTKPAKVLALISLVIAAQIAASAATQTIAFDAIPNQIFGVSPFFAVAQASSGLPVTFASTTPTVCRMAGSLIILLTPGACSIAANQAGNGAYDAAPTVTGSFTVNQAKPTGTLDTGSSLSLGSLSYNVLTADFNGDGIPDLATVDFSSDSLTILLGNGAGAFSPTSASPLLLATNFLFMAEGDFNEDGTPDVRRERGCRIGSADCPLRRWLRRLYLLERRIVHRGRRGIPCCCGRFE